MSTRRNATAALLSLPIISAAIEKKDKKPIPGPLSEEAARIISYTIYAEARGEPSKGKKAVAAVIHTRSKQLNLSLAAVCLQDQQFSCWNEISEVPENYHLGIGLQPADIKARNYCYGLAWLLISGHIKWDFLTHFYNPSKASPEWRHEMRGTRMIGRHVFGYIN
ncbi:MAG: cell wall hydrolase [Kiritimatiellaceae bacterium]|nr:cell wall hydrolase [Kiritimatiellaceae bacterium]